MFNYSEYNKDVMKEVQYETKTMANKSSQTEEGNFRHIDKSKVYDRVENTIRCDLIKMVCLAEEYISSGV